MIDALEAILLWCKAQPGITALVDTRIAARHRFRLTSGGGWEDTATALTVRLTTGETADLDGASNRVRAEARAYGGSSAEALSVATALLNALNGRNGRSVVTTPAGRALIYWLVADGGPSLDVDLDTGFDVAIVPLRASVALADVT